MNPLSSASACACSSPFRNARRQLGQRAASVKQSLRQYGHDVRPTLSPYHLLAAACQSSAVSSPLFFCPLATVVKGTRPCLTSSSAMLVFIASLALTRGLLGPAYFSLTRTLAQPVPAQ